MLERPEEKTSSPKNKSKLAQLQQHYVVVKSTIDCTTIAVFKL